MNSFGIYIHIPFCRRICNYCDFTKRVSNKVTIDKYVDYLINEINLYENKNIDFLKVKTIYIGGGTPSSIGIENLKKIFSKINSIVNIENIEEFSIEVNPEDLSDELIEVLREYKVNRVSIGVQTFDEVLLQSLNRRFDLTSFEKYYFKLKNSIPNINLDLMYAIPGQSLDNLKNTLQKIKQLEPKHVSLYSLILEENTVFYYLYKQNKLKLIDENEEKQMYDLIHKILGDEYLQYEVSNYCQKGFESKHNMLYWRNQNYLGFGLSAASFFDNIRFKNTTSLKEYFSSIDIEKFPTTEYEKISLEDDKKYEIILGFRLIEGIDLNRYQAKYLCNIFNDFPKLIEFINDGYFEIVDNHIKIKQEYIYVMDHFLEQLI